MHLAARKARADRSSAPRERVASLRTDRETRAPLGRLARRCVRLSRRQRRRRRHRIRARGRSAARARTRRRRRPCDSRRPSSRSASTGCASARKRAFSCTPWPAGYSPVIIELCEGSVSGAVAYACRNRRPRAASASNAPCVLRAGLGSDGVSARRVERDEKDGGTGCGGRIGARSRRIRAAAGTGPARAGNGEAGEDEHKAPKCHVSVCSIVPD